MGALAIVDEPREAILTKSDGVGVSYWIISIAMSAATVLFFAEASTERGHWRTSLHIGGLVPCRAPIQRLEHHRVSAGD